LITELQKVLFHGRYSGSGEYDFAWAIMY